MKKIVAFLVVCLYIAGTATVWGQSFVGPQDYTSKMTNPAFTDVTDDGKARWSFAPKTDENGYAESFTAVDGCAEQWQRNYDFYQTLTGLPNGLYKVSVQGFYRDGGTATANKVRNAYLYANEVSVPLKSILDEASENLTGSSGVTITEGDKSVTYNCPNSIGEASSHFEKGLYGNELFVTVTDGTLKLGIRDEVTVSGDWAAFDNFKLTYYPEGRTTSGSYYLRNRQSGKFLTGGNNWGTQATLHETGIDLTFSFSESDRKYTIATGLNRDANNCYLNSNGFLDGAKIGYTLNPVNGGYYSISVNGFKEFLSPSTDGSSRAAFTGVDQNQPAAQWELLTKDELIAELNQASLGNPMNATFLISGFDFNKYDVRNGTWESNPSVGGYAASASGAQCAKTTGASFDVWQELSDLPAGTYVLTAYACFQNGADANSTAVTASLYAGDKQVALPTINDGGTRPTSYQTAVDAFLSGRYQTAQVKVQVSEGTLRIGVKNNGGNATDVAYFDNFHLTYWGAEEPITNPYTGSGKFYLQNVSTGEYLQGGGIDGLQAMLGNGIEFELVKNALDGIYSIRNVGINPDGNDYLCDEGRLDHQPVNFVITETSSGSGVYNIAAWKQHCNNDGGYNMDDLSNRLLTAVAGSPVGERYKNLSDFTFQKWTQAAPGGVYEATETYDNNIGNGNSIGAGGMVYGLSGVFPQSYADLSGYQSMFIKATPGTVLRVLINRNGINGTTDAEKGRTVEIISVVEDDGYAVVDLSRYSHVHLNAIKLHSGSPAPAVVESIVLAKQPAKTANLSGIQFLLWNQDAPGGTSSSTGFDNAIGGAAQAPGGTFFGDPSVTKLKYADLTGYTTMTIKGSPGAPLQIRINREDDNTTTYEGSTENVTIGSDGYAVVNLSKYKFVHLHSIKHAWGTPLASASVESITLSRPDVVSFLNDPDINQWDPRAQWRFVTEAQRIAELENGTAQDATFLIKNASLTEIDNDNNSGSAEASPFWKSAEHWYFVQRDWTAHSDGAGGIVKSDKATDDLYQELTNLPNGLYEVSMQGCYRNFDNAVFYANGSSVLLDQAGSEFDACVKDNHSNCTCRRVASVQTYGTSNYKKTLRVVVADGKLRIGVKGSKNADNNLLILDNFHLTYLDKTATPEIVVVSASEGSKFGTFYLKNKEKGTYLTAGGTDGVSAVLGDQMYEHSIYNNNDNRYKKGVRETDFTLEAVADGKWVIKTGIGAGYLNSSAKLNVAYDENTTSFELRYKSGKDYGFYYIVHGASYFNGSEWVEVSGDELGQNFQWVFQTKEDLVAELDPNVASEANPIDATFLLRGTAFHKEDSRNSAWTGIQSIGGEGGPDGAVHPNYVGEVKEPRFLFDVSQKVTGVPNGVYEFTLQGYFKNTKSGGHTVDNTAFYYVSTDGKKVVDKNTSAKSPHIKSAYYLVQHTDDKGNILDQPDNPYEASVLFEAEHQTNLHDPIRFRVENGTIILGVYRSSNPNGANHPDLFIDNVRLTYLGETTANVATSTNDQGIIHKPSRFYELAEANGDLTLDKNTYTATKNNTTLSDKAMVKHETDRWIQHTPVYRETIYAMPGQEMAIVMPTAYTKKYFSSNRYYQRIYNYANDDLFDNIHYETGKVVTDQGSFNFTCVNTDGGTVHTHQQIVNAMRTYEGSEIRNAKNEVVISHPAGGWVMGSRWGQQLVAEFVYTAPASFSSAIQIGIDHSDFKDVGDMGMVGDLTEPTLGQRIVYTIQPASVMVDNLASCTGDKYFEEKSISFPTIWFGGQKDMNPDDRNAVALDLQLRNYFTNASKVPVSSDFTIALDDGGTGITLHTESFSGNTERFIWFNYPDGGEVTNYKDKEAVITVKSNGKNIARFRLHFVPNTELRPWGDIMGKGKLRRSPTYLDKHAVLIDKLDFDMADLAQTTHPGSWPVGDETASINGQEGTSGINHADKFYAYPLDFDQTSFGVYYPNAEWGQYSVMKELHCFNHVSQFKDVNQLYHDYLSEQGMGAEYRGGGNFMYIDASNFPSSVATLKLEEELCEGTTIHFTGWMTAMDAALKWEDKWVNNDNAPGYLLFSIVGIKGDDTQEVIESFCPGPARADAMRYIDKDVAAEARLLGVKVTADDYNIWEKGSRFIWQQFAFSFVVEGEAANYKSYALKIDNYCSKTSGGDMMVDDVRLYIQRAVPVIMQNAPICVTGDVENGGSRPVMEISTTFKELLGAADLTEAASEEKALASYGTNAGETILPSGWYCFLDQEVYEKACNFSHNDMTDAEIVAKYKEAFNEALVKSGGDGNGFYQFNFSACFESNDGGNKAYPYGTYMAVGEEVATPSGEIEKRIYLNLEDCAVSLKSLPNYVKNGEDWTLASASENNLPAWNMNNETTDVVYGQADGTTTRYVDLSAYDELRIYQSSDDAKDNDNRGPVRCFFFPKAGTGDVNFCVSNKNSENSDFPDVACNMSFKRVGDYWSVDLAKVKELTGEVKLICIKGRAPGRPAQVSAVNVVGEIADLKPDRSYTIVFHANKTGETPEADPATFFQLDKKDQKCAATHSFSLVSGTELRYDGGLDSEGVKYCEGQVATLKMEVKGIDTAAGETVKQEDVFYDWWLGDVASFSSVASGKHDSPQNVLFDFRDAYPDATIYDGQQARTETLDGYTYDFTEEDRDYLENLVKDGKFLLYQSSLNVRITASSGYQAVSVMPIVSLLENLTGLPYCKGPIEIRIPVEHKSPSAKNGFAGTSYPMDEVPVRIGLSQLKSATDADNASWVTDNTSSLYIPLRDVEFSDDSKYTSFGIKMHEWGEGSSNELKIAAVYLAETNDPDMVSYGEDKEGNRELRYVGKMHKFNATGDSERGRFEDYVELTFNPEFTENVKEGYRYTLKTSFEESGTITSSDGEGGTTTTTVTNTDGCAGDLLIPLYIVPEYQVWAGGPTGNWANDDNWRRADNPELKLAAGDPRPTNKQNTTASGFVPMSFTHVLMKTDTQATLEGVTKTTDGTELVVFPTPTQLGKPTLKIQYHLAAETKAPAFSWFPQERTRDIYCEPFYTNTAKEVHFEPRSQMLGSEHLTYQRAWVEYALTSGRWYALASPLQGVVSGDMYLPRNTGKQQTPYFQEITYDNTRYSRLAPAVYQQAWDKAEALTYRLERDELVNKLPPRLENGTAKVNVARALDWSREYNDAKVPFSQGGFSVKVDMSRTEGYTDPAEGVSDVLLRLPKSDKQYDYYLYDDDTDGSETAELTELTGADGKPLRENAGKLMTDQLKNGGTMTVTLKNNGGDSNPYYLVANPFVSGLDLDEFFYTHKSLLENSYWILNNNTYETGVKTTEGWISTDNGGTADRVAPLQAFFVKVKEGAPQELTLNFTRKMAVALTDTTALKTRAAGDVPVLRLTARRHGVESHAMVVRSEDAAEGFVAGEDVEALFDSHLAQAPTLYTSAGDVAAAINVCRTLHGLPVGIASEDDSDVELLFEGVEAWTDELYLYDMESGESTPVTGSGCVIGVQGNSYGRYYLVTTPIDASATDPAPLVQVDGEVVTVTSLADEISAITVHDVPGRRVYRKENAGHRAAFTLPEGVYMVTVKTAHQQIVRKVQICDL